MALPTLFQYAAKLGTALTGAFGNAYTLTGVSIVGSVGTITYSIAGSPAGSAVFNVNQGAQFNGVPGPEMAAGLPFLVAAATYGGYRMLRARRAAA